MKNKKWMLSAIFLKIPALMAIGLLILMPIIIIIWIIMIGVNIILTIFAPITMLVTKHTNSEYHTLMAIGIVLIIMFFVGALSQIGLLKVVKLQLIKIRNSFYRAILKAGGKGMVVKVKSYGNEGAEELGIFMELVEESCDGKNIIKAKVLIPTVPAPITGLMRFFTLDMVWKTNITLDELIKQITSFGLVSLEKKLITRRFDTISPEDLTSF